MHFLREICVFSGLMLFSVLFGTPRTNAACLENFPEANSTNVVAMCTESTVTGHDLFIDNSQSLSLPLQPGSICTCTAHTGDGTFNVSVGYTGPSFPSCGNYIEYTTNSTSNKVTCQTDNLGTVFSEISNVSVVYHTVSSNADGEYCVKLQSKCTADEFQCTDGTCRPLASICDAFPDCPDRSDEADNLCVSPLCNEGQVLCADQLQCIDESQRCDGNFECNDHSDENNCVNGSYVPANVTTSKFDSTITIQCSKVVEPPTITTVPTSSTTSTSAPTTSTPSTATPITSTPSTAAPTTLTPSTVASSSTSSPTTSTVSSTVIPTTSTISSSPSLTSTTPPIVSSTEPGDGTNVGLIVGIVVAVLIVTALIIGGVVFYRKYYYNVKKYFVEKMHKENNVPHYENPTGKPARARNGDVIVPEHEYDEIKLDSI